MSRYARQEILPQVGERGQRRLRDAHVLIVGAGALGCPVMQYLAGAGIGRLTIVDPDTVSRSNLHRQPIYGESNLGEPKVWAARSALSNLNPEVQVIARAERLDPANAAGLVAEADIVLDCADSFAATYTLSDTCHAQAKPFITASVLGLTGYAGGFCGPAPSIRAVFPELPARAASCATAGVLGPVAGLLGCLEAQMALGVLLGLEPSPLGQMCLIDFEHCGQSYGLRSFRFDAAPEPDEPVMPFIAVAEIDRRDFIVDLRGEEEAPIAVHPDAIRASVEEFRNATPMPPQGQRAVLCCRSGLRAWNAGRALRAYWQGPIALVAVGDAPSNTPP